MPNKIEKDRGIQQRYDEWSASDYRPNEGCGPVVVFTVIVSISLLIIMIAILILIQRMA